MDQKELDTRLYYSGLISAVQSCNESSMDIDDLNELAAAMADTKINRWLWDALLELGGSEMSEGRREVLAIAIYEVLAEPPAHPLWIESLVRIISDERLRWIAIRSYLHCPESFYPDFCAADAKAREGLVRDHEN